MSLRKKKHKSEHSGGKSVSTTFYNSVLQKIRQHARGTPHMEICGALIGRQSDEGTLVTGAVAGEGATKGGSHVTFTQETWVKIHEEKNKRYPGQAIVGWYHSHPGFGVFLSDHDIFIHKNFFSQPGSLAWVYDPQSDEEGCFGWSGANIRRVVRFDVVADAEQQSGSRLEPSRLLGSKPPTPANCLVFWRLPKNTRILVLLVLAALLGAGVWWFSTLVLDTKPVIDTHGDNRSQPIRAAGEIPKNLNEQHKVKGDQEGSGSTVSKDASTRKRKNLKGQVGGLQDE